MLLKPKAAAELLGVSISLIYQLCNDGLLPHYRFGGKGRRGHVRIDDADLRAFTEQCRREASASWPGGGAAPERRGLPAADRAMQ